MSSQQNYKIVFKQNDTSVNIAENIPTIEEAVTFSLNLHKASNSKHTIYVMHEDMIDITFSLCTADFL